MTDWQTNLQTDFQQDSFSSTKHSWFVMPKNCNHTWRHKKQATSIVCGPVSVPAFHVCSDLVHYKKNCNFFVLCIACLGNLVQSNILAKMCLKKPPFASKALNMVSPKVVLCSQFNQRRQWFSTFWLNGWFDCSLITGNVMSEFCKTSLGCPINNCYIVIKFSLKNSVSKSLWNMLSRLQQKFPSR